MIRTIAKLIGATDKDFKTHGVLNSSLDVDTRLFIDAKLLQNASEIDFKDSYSRVHSEFQNIIKLTKVSRAKYDRAWMAAQRKLSRGEAPWLCIGYSKSGVRGSGIGPEQADFILDTIKDILSFGIEDEEIFELLGVFQEGIGSDKISDLIANIIISDIADYSERVYGILAKNKDGFTGYEIGERKLRLPENVPQKSPVLILPKSILRDLPTALDWSDIDTVSSHNAALRDKVNGDIGNNWRQARKVPKIKLKEVLDKNPELYRDLIDQYKDETGVEYNYENDPAGQVIWINAAEEAISTHPLALSLAAKPTQDDVYGVVKKYV